MFLKRIFKNIKTNALNILVVHLWFPNTNIQFILDPYVTTTYCTSYMKKIDKSITLELHSIIKKCIANNINTNTRIQKLGNFFLMPNKCLLHFLFTLCFLYHYIIHLEHFNS
jgi:hypothetical protein